MSKERVLITGGAGYIGSVLTNNLLNIGHRVTCLDNLLYKQDSISRFISDSNYKFIYGDARDERILRDLAKNAEVIIPLAAYVGMPICNKLPKKEVESLNYESVVKLNNLRSNSQKLIYPTTNSGYGETDGNSFCDESSPLHPVSLYGETKAAAEKYLLENEKDVIAFRLATVFGFSPRMRLDLLVNDFTYKALKKKSLTLFQPHYKRNFVHIRDIARVFIHSIDNFQTMKKDKLYNVVLSEANMTKEDLALRIKKYIPDLEIKIGEGKDPDNRNYIVSCQRLLNTGFKFEHSLDEGIKELIYFYKSLPENISLESWNNAHYAIAT